MSEPLSPVTERWAIALHALYHGHLSGATCEMCRNCAICLIGIQQHVLGLVDKAEKDSEKPSSIN